MSEKFQTFRSKERARSGFVGKERGGLGKDGGGSGQRMHFVGKKLIIVGKENCIICRYPLFQDILAVIVTHRKRG